MGMPAKCLKTETQGSKIESEIKKVYVKGQGNWYSAYTNYYITDKADFLYMINISGYDSATKGVASTLIKGGYLYIDNKSHYFSGNARMIKQKKGKYTNTLLVNLNFIDQKYESCFILKENELLEEKVYKLLKDNYTVPIIKEWMSKICDILLDHEYMTELYVFSANPDYPKKAYSLKITEINLHNIITENVKTGVLKIPGPQEEDLAEIETLDDYLLKYGKELATKVVDKNKPLFVPGEDEYPSFINNLKRKPIGIQNDAIATAVKKLKTDDAVIINGEMGTGKTLLGAAIPYVLEEGRPTRALVMCPGHLVHKWNREIKNTIPGAKTFVIRSISDLRRIRKKPQGIEYYVISKDRAKLGYVLIPGVTYKESTLGKHGPAYCPRCDEILQRGNNYLKFDKPRKSNYKCPSCGEVLWQADNTRLRRYPPAKYISNKMKGYFDYLVADEVHELKGETAQGNSFGQLSSVCRKTIALTGTLAGGYASNLFYILYRMFPQKLSRNFRYDRITDFVEQYGFVERQYEKDEWDTDLNTASFGAKGRLLNTKELPGISPMLFPHYLMDSCIYISLADLQINLPDYNEEVRLVDMEGEQLEAYNELQDKLHQAVMDCLRSGSKALLSTYLINLLSYPDRPFDNEPIREPDTGGILYIPQVLSKDTIYPKEQELLDLIQAEKTEGRRVFVYSQYTNKRDIMKRLQKILSNHGIITAVLRSNTVKQEKREQWINDKVSEGVDVIIANPELVKTGLDLLAFPSIVFYQCGYSLYTLMQASRRSWRIGQHLGVKVFFFAYRDTMQEKALQLMGKKYEASMVVNGKFSLDGLAQMAEEDSMIVALAKALTGKIGVKESAENIWKRLYKPIVRSKTLYPNVQKQEVQYEGQLSILNMLKEINTTKPAKKYRTAQGQLCLDFDRLF